VTAAVTAGLEPELTWNLVADVRQVLDFPFTVNTLCADRHPRLGPVR